MSDPIFKKVAVFQYPSEAHIFEGKLEAHGIEVFMRDHNTINSDPMISNAVGGVKLFVKNEDYDRATALLGEISRYSVDGSGKAVICPNCGSDKVEVVSSIKGESTTFKFILTTLLGMFPLSVKYPYKCSDCGHEFKHK